MSFETYFWTGDPDLTLVKSIYYACIDSSNSKFKKACKDIADNIKKPIFLATDLSEPKTVQKPICILIFSDNVLSTLERGSKTKIHAMAEVKKDKGFLYVYQLSGISSGGQALLNFLIQEYRSGRTTYRQIRLHAANSDKLLIAKYSEWGAGFGVKVSVVNGGDVIYDI